MSWRAVRDDRTKEVRALRTTGHVLRMGPPCLVLNDAMHSIARVIGYWRNCFRSLPLKSAVHWAARSAPRSCP